MQALVKFSEAAHAFGGYNGKKSAMKKNSLRCLTGFYDTVKFSNVEIGLQANAGKVEMEFPASADRLIN